MEWVVTITTLLPCGELCPERHKAEDSLEALDIVQHYFNEPELYTEGLPLVSITMEPTE